jgi:hypothetical protein
VVDICDSGNELSGFIKCQESLELVFKHVSGS